MSSVHGTQELLEAAMRGAWQRQTVLTNNIANAETPNYARSELDFQGALRSAVASGESLGSLNFEPEVQAQAATPNGNGVSIDQESALLAENGLDYESLTKTLSAYDETLRAAMGL